MNRSLLIVAGMSVGFVDSAENKNLSDEDAAKAAENTFKSGGWNSEIFEQKPVTVRQVTITKFFREGQIRYSKRSC